LHTTPPPTRVKVAYVITTLDVGGAEGQLALLTEGLDRTRFEILVVTLGDESVLTQRLRHAGIKVTVLRLRTAAGRHALRVPSAVWRLLREIRRFRPFIVHGVLMHGCLLGGFAARFQRVPVFIASRRGLADLKTRSRVLLAVESWVNRFTRIVVANSEAVRQDAIQSEHLPPGKVCVIHNGIDVTGYARVPDEAVRADLHLRDGDPVIGVNANFIRYKGHVPFFHAFAQLVAEHPRAVALLIGDGPERGRCEALSRELRLGHAVRFLGTRADVPRLMSVVDFVVHPSLSEGFPNAILEAMASGKPVVATDVGGSAEAVVEGVTGFVVPPGIDEALLAPMRILARDVTRRQTMGAAARQRVLSEFALDKMIRRYECLYEAVLADPSGKSVPSVTLMSST
jgi:glycosyltransferase involved in cell wall biosynthesis